MSEYVYDCEHVLQSAFSKKLEFVLLLLDHYRRNAIVFNDVWQRYNKDNKEPCFVYPYSEASRANMERYRVLLTGAMKKLCEYSYGRIKK